MLKVLDALEWLILSNSMIGIINCRSLNNTLHSLSLRNPFKNKKIMEIKKN